MPDRSYRLLLWSLALFGLLADQGSKYGVFSWLHGVETHTYAIFQTAPVQRYFAVVPPETDPLLRMQQPQGFFLEAAFEPELDANGQPIPHVNHGALFGFLRNYKFAANSAFAVISLLAAAAIVLWSYQKATASDRWLCIALGLILGGTLGNFYDRLMFNGVRDFLHWNYLFDWPVFNLADCWLVVGACLLLLQAFLVPQPVAPPAPATTTENNFGSTPQPVQM
ncbi:MAG: signal peptidase II [Gemmataceae bacterium]